MNYIRNVLFLFDECYIPEIVFEEIKAKDDSVQSVLKEFISSEKVRIQGINHFHLFNGLCSRLGKGEASAIALALEIEADFIILDDNPARKTADELGLFVKGTLGILRKLIDNKVIVIKDYDRLF